ncbi:MAG TPA: hypothetical protein VHU43_02785 [Steroidobacteraceae bacterium]|nr:hypothetical protein [Steroidobacteraceae bacterium]
MPAVNQHRSNAAFSARAAPAILAASLLFAGCGSSSNAPAPDTAPVPPPLADRPDVIVTFDGPRHTCVAALYSEPQGSAISCADLVPFLRDELRVPSGAIYDIRTIPTFDAAEMAKTAAGLKDAGYRFIGGRRDMFTAEPRTKN